MRTHLFYGIVLLAFILAYWSLKSVEIVTSATDGARLELIIPHDETEFDVPDAPPVRLPVPDTVWGDQSDQHRPQMDDAT